MRSLYYFLLLPMILHSCCCGNTKCDIGPSTYPFRIVQKVSGQDLVFGPSRIYDKDFIKFYSLSGSDTITHFYGAGANPDPGGDSLLYVTFDFNRPETAYVRLSAADTDTLRLTYQLEESSNCCPDYYDITSILHNGTVLPVVQGVRIISK